MLLCGYIPVTWQTFPATPKCLTTNFLLISTSPFSSYLSSYKNMILEPAAKKCQFHQSPETGNQFFLSLVILRNCQLAFQPPHQNNQGLSEFYFSLYLSSASSLCYINSKTLTNCSPVTSPCKSVALLPCLTTQNSASSLHKEREQCWVLGNCSLLPGLRQPN